MPLEKWKVILSDYLISGHHFSYDGMTVINMCFFLSPKIYTCVNESVLAEYIPFSTTKLKLYEHMDIPSTLSEGLTHALTSLRKKVM